MHLHINVCVRICRNTNTSDIVIGPIKLFDKVDPNSLTFYNVTIQHPQLVTDL